MSDMRTLYLRNVPDDVMDRLERLALLSKMSVTAVAIRELDAATRRVANAALVATLPDLTQMESDTYINEVDVRKIAVGQKVGIALDADPTKKLSGTVTSVANVGEQRPNQDSKVFEVKIVVEQSDTTLRPGMTTSNAIETASLARVLSIPLEAATTEGGLSFVYKRDGSRVVKQQIETGVLNDNDIVVRRGLQKGDKVLLVPPADKASLKVELIPGLKPMTPAPPGGDTAKRVTLPARQPGT